MSTCVSIDAAMLAALRPTTGAFCAHLSIITLIRSRLSAPLAAIESSPPDPSNGDNALCLPVPPPSRLRLSRLDSARRALARQDRRFSYARLLTFAAESALLIAGWRALTPFWLVALPAVVFLMLVQRHDRVLRRLAAVIDRSASTSGGWRASRTAGWGPESLATDFGRPAPVCQ